MYGNPYVFMLKYSNSNSILEAKDKMPMARIIEAIIVLKRGIGMIEEMIGGIGRIEEIEGINGEMRGGMTGGDKIEEMTDGEKTEEMITERIGGGMIDGEMKDVIDVKTEKIIIVENIVVSGDRGGEVTIMDIMGMVAQVVIVKDVS